MEGLFRQIGIYNPHGQNYVPSDRGFSGFTTSEAKDGQVLQEGINELGAASSWSAAAKSHTLSVISDDSILYLLPMFGFQRVRT